ncbi:MAG: mannose-6-phosphate isomerase, class I [Brevibacterium aurantiacum]|uniref:mannose-6-phosphate isomerase n=1 Tax=Brevibacterium aurantiacum TaxID=273384 RepID=A0A1D7W2F4_BREAU|nr:MULTISPECIES: mannose-6-phosphate isomerase, class I [Brevibacterium]MDN5552406.1 mannose-6-phosphate isomerase, class I [Brevibacterium sp.]AOP53203.1 Mannose-6-phosphate isomerase [Brevibacterium aurantiacum]AZL09024.1 mannose-6-phosphate isomerase, class I [Brevibacterium aurantiacum]AZL12635.1 mannose-6-phosphate isomerase, class I [Brevibacterium aurantiacum]AZT93110.1 mannose-6-phosphate isomerase, class I [Brevibacterium aurantiacum]
MRRLHNTVKNFAWGSTDAIPAILGTAPDGTPCAELWLGAHPLSPSRLDNGQFDQQSSTHRSAQQGSSSSVDVKTNSTTVGPNLIEYLAGDPAGLLGHDSVQVFGPRLPFLLKVLSAQKALSIQVHPNPEQAALGFAREESEGPDLDSPTRNYKDPSAKPELIYALTEFHALTGFRSRKAVRSTFERLLSLSLSPTSLDFLGDVLSALKSVTEAKAFARAVELVLGDSRSAGFVDEVAGQDLAELPDGHISRSGTAVDPAETFQELVADYPSDPGVLVALMLNRVHLQPGEALAMESGVLHAYLGGTGIEVMASSDNVLRGGLTNKHIDIPELGKVAKFTSAKPRMVEPDRDGILLGATEDFALQSLRCPRLTQIERRGASIALCTSGSITLTSLGSTVTLTRGQSVFIAANEPTVTADGHGDLFVATTGLDNSLPFA